MTQKSFLKFALIGVVLFGIAICGAGVTFLKTWKPYQHAPTPTLELEIPEGLTAWHLVPYLMSQKQAIQFPLPAFFRWQARWHYRHKHLQAGVFQLNRDETFSDWLSKFEKGHPKLYEVLIAEGLTYKEIAHRLKEEGILEDVETFLTLATSSAFLSENHIPALSVEGYLFPSTYLLPKPYQPEALLSALIRMQKNKMAELDLRMKHPYLKSHHDYLILASIIEKETGVPEERAAISGVFHNRLAKGMRLESDPTTIYGIENFDGNLRKKDLLTKTQYNTYRIKGLPAGPIANPGLEAIQAAYHPEVHDYLFFVSKNDGSHVFSSSYQEHQRFVDVYQKRLLRKNRR